jgi:hypothetical protein
MKVYPHMKHFIPKESRYGKKIGMCTWKEKYKTLFS